MSDRSIDFIGIGAMRCATTWISRCIEEHPQLFIPPAHKELHFFDAIRKSPQSPERERVNYSKGLAWYRSFFADADPQQNVGEYTPNYFSDAEAPRLIHENFPSVKLILSVRDPISRLRSHHSYVLRNQEGIPESLEAAIRTKNEVFQFLEAGMYGEHLQRYLEYFPREQVHLIRYEDIRDRPGEVCRVLYEFLKVDSTFMPQAFTQRVNTSNQAKSVTVLQAMRHIKQSIKKASWLRKTVDRVGGVHIGRWINRLNQGEVDAGSTRMDPDTLAYLKQYYHEDITLLEQLTGEDLSQWKRDDE